MIKRKKKYGIEKRKKKKEKKEIMTWETSTRYHV